MENVSLAPLGPGSEGLFLSRVLVLFVSCFFGCPPLLTYILELNSDGSQRCVRRKLIFLELHNWLISHYQVAFCLRVKTSLLVKPSL